MEDGIYDHNRIVLQGVAAESPELSHALFEERFFRMMLDVSRLSGNIDTVPVTVPERLLLSRPVGIGDKVVVRGQVRSYNRMEEGKNRLILTAFARYLGPPEPDIVNPNDVMLDGFLCRVPNYRTTPFGREITDLLIAVNRPYGKSDYIPVIAWGHVARRAQTLDVGSHIIISGRLQSRDYQKKLDDETVVNRVAYEVSVTELLLADREGARQDGQATDR
ncbi:MAG: single-stranded DNA-binding protein [Clostridiales bacterium]|nr:single-stranded DNA-binding protein [Clostridiales bacterium]